MVAGVKKGTGKKTAGFAGGYLVPGSGYHYAAI